MRTGALAAVTSVLATAVIVAGSAIALTSTSSARADSGATASPTARASKTSAASPPPPASAAAPAEVREGICTAPAADKAIAARLAADIRGALRGREGYQGVTVYDAMTGISCSDDSSRPMDSASIVKTIILAALLRWHQETGTALSAYEQDEATAMITESDDDAATDLWDEVGRTRLQQFLDAAKMTETELGGGGYWGLTQVTAHDEMLLLRLLDQTNSVLTAASRSYELGLMADVISSQRWGTPAGAPGDVTVHVKNGWLGDASGWHINSLGLFTGEDRNYMMAVLTTAGPSEEYGIDTIEGVARLVNQDLSQADAAAESAASAARSSASAEATVPALPS
jgi:Beta-lactamase enzyme family